MRFTEYQTLETRIRRRQPLDRIPTPGRTTVALVLLAALLGVPIASSLTWSNAATDNVLTPAAGASSYHSLVVLSPATWLVAYFYDVDDDLRIAKTTNSGATWTATSVDVTGSVGYFPHGDAPPGSTRDAYVCYADGTANDIKVAYTHDAGLSWGVSAIAISGTQQRCSVWAVSPDVVVVVVADTTGGVYKSVRSTNGGGTWATPVTMYASASAEYAAIAAENTTRAVAVLRSGTSGVRSCATTNQAVTWTCGGADIPAITTPPRQLSHVGGDDYVFGIAEAPATFNVFKTTNGGTTWTQQVGPSPSDIGGAVTLQAVGAFVAVDEKRWSMFLGWTQDVQGNDGAVITYTSTIDGGVSWSAQEMVLDGSATAGTGLGGCPYLDAAATGEIRLAVAAGCITYQAAASYGAGVVANAFYELGVNQAAESTTVTDLVGMTIDPTGRLLVARTDNGAFVRNYNAQSLGTGTTGTYATPDCATNIRPGIMAQFPNVGFLDCVGDPNFEILRIRNSQMGAPEAPRDPYGACPTAVGDACAMDYGASGGNGDYGQFGNLHEVNAFDQTFGLDYTLSARRAPTCTASRLSGGSPGDCGWQNFLMWTFSTTNGKLGVHTLAAKDGAIADRRHEYTVQYAASTTTTVNHMCTASAVGPGTYMVGAEPSTAAQEYRITVTTGNGDILTTDLTASIQQVWSGSGLNYQAQAVACGKDRVILFNPNFNPGRIVAVRPTDGAFVYAVNLEGAGADRGLAMARDVPFGVYVDGAKLKVFNTTDGTVTGTYALPAGAFKDIRMDSAGQNVWVATSTRIARYVIYEDTTVVPQPINAGTGPACDGTQFICVDVPNQVEGIYPLGQGAVGSKVPGAGIPIVGFVLFAATIGGSGYGAYRMGVRGGMILIVLFGALCVAAVAFRPDLLWIPISIVIVAIFGLAIGLIGRNG